MKFALGLIALAAGSAVAAPVPEPVPDAQPEASPELAERDGPSLVTYAVGGFRITNVSTTIKPWSLVTQSTGNAVSFTAQPLSATYQNLGSPITCNKTWQDSLLKGTGSVAVACSDPKMSIFVYRNYLATTEYSVYLAYNLSKSAGTNKTQTSQYQTKFTFNQNSVQLKCTKDKANAQNCVSSGTSLLASTLSEKVL
ncbi:hypothetical protein CAC42_975 [Sphaceloma murrayae]|uniref:Uncharacterized protein n=1 Tax=Sphaceloma murrayae TaxID=2082308 RepID=A0A2K1R2U6_9PEZI|nr:hypothetical protein CAC42_975 [Sphaceloma murrayae]